LRCDADSQKQYYRSGFVTSTLIGRHVSFATSKYRLVLSAKKDVTPCINKSLTHSSLTKGSCKKRC